MSEHRRYDPQRDRDAAFRIWREVGWLDPDDETAALGAEVFLAAGRGLVVDVEGSPECLAVTTPATMRHLDEILDVSVVAAVTTSHVARRQGFAGRLTAAAIADDAAAGAAASVLGIFDQGFYDRLGYGTGSPTPWRSLDPADLRVPVRARPPQRLGVDDWEAMHAGRLGGAQGHGLVTITAAEYTRAEALLVPNGFGLGYRDTDGAVTHHVWLEAKDLEHGPLTVDWMAYRTSDELLELLALLGTLSDQYHALRMQEPPGVRLQDLLRRPFRSVMTTRRAEFETGIEAHAYWQVRICDLDRCLAALRPVGPDVAFNLTLSDPIGALLPGGSAWGGIAGDYVVELADGAASATPGSAGRLPTLTASVGAFSRWWLGVLPATSLAVTDRFQGPSTLLASLDRAVRLPTPQPYWDF